MCATKDGCIKQQTDKQASDKRTGKRVDRKSTSDDILFLLPQGRRCRQLNAAAARSLGRRSSVVQTRPRKSVNMQEWQDRQQQEHKKETCEEEARKQMSSER
jgi:hypothetical protein